jgi:hypothetical protein
MNRLINVSRNEGFPWCAETAEALNSNVQYVEAIMDGFNIDDNHAIILSDTILYIKDTMIGGRVAKITEIYTDIDPSDPDYPSRRNLLDNPGKYTLFRRNSYIDINKQNSDSEVYPSCIFNELYEIALANVGERGWTFYEMADIFEREIMTTIPNCLNRDLLD